MGMTPVAVTMAVPPLAMDDVAHLPDAEVAALGFLCFVLASLFFLSSVGRDRPRQRIGALFGGPVATLAPLRGALLAKARAQAAAVLFLLGSSLLLVGALTPFDLGGFLFVASSVLLFLAAAAFRLLLGGYVATAMRRYLAAYLRNAAFPFEENVGLTREIGARFGVVTRPEDTMESYVTRLRAELGLDERSGAASRSRSMLR